MGDIQFFALDTKTGRMELVTLAAWYAVSADLTYPRVRVTDDGDTERQTVRGSVAGVLAYARGRTILSSDTHAESGYTVARVA